MTRSHGTIDPEKLEAKIERCRTHDFENPINAHDEVRP
jgi:hypothetical protein